MKANRKKHDQDSSLSQGTWPSAQGYSLRLAAERIKAAIFRLDDRELERLVAAILRALGYYARVAPQGPDRGVDILASEDRLFLKGLRLKVQVKHRPSNRIGAPDIRSFLGAVRSEEKGLYVSTGGFTKEARYEAERAEKTLELMDLDGLFQSIIDNYDKFDPEGKLLLPLAKFYWPIE